MSSSVDISRDTDAHPQRTLFGHPRLVFNLFGLELWERFSYYGVQSILALYLFLAVTEGGVGLSQASALSLVGAYGGSVFFFTVVAAWVADRLWSPPRVLFCGAILMTAGQAALAIVPGMTGVAIGLGTMAVGSGALKSTATAVVGYLYTPKDPRREAGFTLFYAGITAGSFLGPIVSGLVQSLSGFRLAFGVAAVGMVVGLITYRAGRRDLPAAACEVSNPLPRKAYKRACFISLAVIAALTAAFVTGLVNAANLSIVIVGLVTVITTGYFVVILRSNRIDSDERSRVVAFVPHFVGSVVFFAISYQIFSTVVVYVRAELDRSVAGFEVPVAWVVGAEALFGILLGGIFATVWTKLGTRQPSTPIKFVIGLVMLGLSFLFLVPFANAAPLTYSVFLILPVALIGAVSSMFVYPIGLAVTTKLAPKAFSTQMIGLFYLSISIGTALAGSLAQSYSPGTKAEYFTWTGIIPIIGAVALLAMTPKIKKLMRGVK